MCVYEREDVDEVCKEGVVHPPPFSPLHAEVFSFVLIIGRGPTEKLSWTLCSP